MCRNYYFSLKKGGMQRGRAIDGKNYKIRMVEKVLDMRENIIYGDWSTGRSAELAMDIS